MRSIIVCEGSTDYTLIQYFMRKTYAWDDSKEKVFRGDPHFQLTRTFVKNNDTLTIAGTGGCSRITAGVERVLETNRVSSKPEEAFQKIVVITDRDEVGTEQNFISKLQNCFQGQSVQLDTPIENDKWIRGHYINARGKQVECSLLLLVIPFEEKGAMETFLLNAVSKRDVYDANIIQQGNSFVDNVDPEKRYLNKRRYITKAKFDVYFSVRTAVEQFNQRQDILKSVDWENYLDIQTSFKKLSELSTEMS